jgi:hypothetical protein
MSCLGALLLVRNNLHRNAATGDFTGAGLGIALIVTVLLPLTLIALLAALWVYPPRRVGSLVVYLRGASTDAAAPPVVGPVTRTILSVVLGIAAAASLTLAGAMLASGLRGGYEYSGVRGIDLIRLAIQDLLCFSPLIALSAMLAWIAAVIVRPSRRSTGQDPPGTNDADA